jgi:hypothetical protein
MTLTEAAFWTKRLGVIALGALVIFTTIVLMLTLQKEQKMPPQYLTSNYACTQTREEFLEYRLEIPSLELAEGSEMVFQIDTDTGKIDALPEIVNVFEFNNPIQSVTAQADAKVLANRMGFDPDSVTRKGTESYIWVDRENSRTLEIQARNLNFSFKTDPAKIKEVIRDSTLPSEQEAKSKAANILRSLGLGLYSEDYSKGNHKTTFIKINPDGSFSKAASHVDADLIRVDFMRSKSMITIPSNIVGSDTMIQNLTKRLPEPPVVETRIINEKRVDVYTFNTPVSFPRTQESNISVLVGAEQRRARDLALNGIYQIEYTNWPINVESCGTYELLSPQVAIDKVQAGEGSLVYLYDIDGDDVVDYTPRKVKRFLVFDVFVVYYEEREESRFLQPVYLISGEAIFENDVKGLFDFFYPAINYDIIQDKIELPQPEFVENTNGFF